MHSYFTTYLSQIFIATKKGSLLSKTPPQVFYPKNGIVGIIPQQFVHS